jgi:hypothetical protein
MIIAASSGPDWADVMTAFGTLGAVVAAVGIAIWSDRVTNDRILKERGRSDEQRRRERAGFVNSWVELDSYPGTPEGTGDTPSTSGIPRSGPAEGLRYVVRNDSSLPVYNVVLLAPLFYEPEKRLVLANIAIGMLAPNQSHKRVAPDEMKLNYSQPSPIPVIFTDATGTRWHRDDKGELSEVDSSQIDLDGFLLAWDTAPRVKFKHPGISDRTVLFMGQVINVPEK